MPMKDFSDKAEQYAAKFYKQDSLNCAESALKAILLASGQGCPSGLIEMASPFGSGMGAGCTCGALAGAQMALGTFFGRKTPTGANPKICAKMAKSLHDRFREANGATCCRILHKGLRHGSEEQRASCCQRTALAARIAALLICEGLNCPPEEAPSLNGA